MFQSSPTPTIDDSFDVADEEQFQPPAERIEQPEPHNTTQNTTQNTTPNTTPNTQQTPARQSESGTRRKCCLSEGWPLQYHRTRRGNNPPRQRSTPVMSLTHSEYMWQTIFESFARWLHISFNIRLTTFCSRHNPRMQHCNT